MLNAMVLTNLSIIVTLLDVVKQIQKLILLDLKQNKKSHALTCSNAWIVKGIVVATTYYNDKWLHKQVNLKSGYNVGSSQENSTRSLC